MGCCGSAESEQNAGGHTMYVQNKMGKPNANGRVYDEQTQANLLKYQYELENILNANPTALTMAQLQRLNRLRRELGLSGDMHDTALANIGVSIQDFQNRCPNLKGQRDLSDDDLAFFGFDPTTGEFIVRDAQGNRPGQGLAPKPLTAEEKLEQTRARVAAKRAELARKKDEAAALRENAELEKELRRLEREEKQLQADLDEDLAGNIGRVQAHYKFAQLTADDSSGFGNNGTIVGIPELVRGVDGVGTAISFNPKGRDNKDYISFQPKTTLKDFTVLMWVKVKGIRGPDGVGYVWCVDSGDGVAGLCVRREDLCVVHNAKDQRKFDLSFGDGKFHHIALVKDTRGRRQGSKAVSAGTVKCYLDGKMVSYELPFSRPEHEDLLFKNCPMLIGAHPSLTPSHQQADLPDFAPTVDRDGRILVGGSDKFIPQIVGGDKANLLAAVDMELAEFMLQDRAMPEDDILEHFRERAAPEEDDGQPAGDVNALANMELPADCEF